MEFALDTIRTVAGELPAEAAVECRRFPGGLESSRVGEVTVRFCDRHGRPRLLRTVLKELDGWMVREASIYRNLATKYARELSPQLLGVMHPEPGKVFLCIEAIRRAKAWPWQDVELAGDLLRWLARFHLEAKQAHIAVPCWDFEARLEEMAYLTQAAVAGCRKDPDLQPLARSLPAVRRLILQQKRLREQLCGEAPFGEGPIHGDVHSGNVLIRHRQSRLSPILLDWGRARIGSPIEDISSWLQSLGCYEWEAKRRHDKLLCDYLSEIGQERKITSSLRAAYWIAGARNALAGALLHFICAVKDEKRNKRERAEAFRAAQNWTRVILRADAYSRA